MSTGKRPWGVNTPGIAQSNIEKNTDWDTPQAMTAYMNSDFIHDRQNRCLEGRNIPEWMIKGNTTLIQKDSLKEPSPATIDR